MKDMLNIRYAWRLYVSVLLILLVSSCKKLIEIDSPAGQLTTDKVFADDNTATAAISEVYGQFYGNYSIAYPPSLTAGCSSDELDDFTNGFMPFNTNDIKTNDDNNSNMWKGFYNIIYETNGVIEGLQASSGVSMKTKVQLLAEAKFIRAFCYFELINLYGEVPLITTTDVAKNATAARTSTAGVYQQIITDLIDAQSNLSENYVTTDRVRANKSAAGALLARVYLYTQKWADAEQQASAVLANNKYALSTNLKDVFIKNSGEAILQIWTPGYTLLGSLLIPSGVNPNFSFTANFVDSLENGDLRVRDWMGTTTYSNATYYYPLKYRLNAASTGADGEYLMVLRLAEQYLIRAEARANQNNVQGAQDDINMIRNRAGLSNTTAATKNDLLLAIEKERRTELFTEWGHRWFDLKRTGRIDAVLSLAKPQNWKPYAALYPIPLVEVKANVKLLQNPGYE